VIELGPSDARISSGLAEVECLRTIDRLRLLRALDEVAQVRAREVVYKAFESCDVLETGAAVLQRASMPFPTTHDRALARASRSVGLEVVGTA
jgi:hypothetical protein